MLSIHVTVLPAGLPAVLDADLIWMMVAIEGGTLLYLKDVASMQCLCVKESTAAMEHRIETARKRKALREGYSNGVT